MLTLSAVATPMPKWIYCLTTTIATTKFVGEIQDYVDLFAKGALDKKGIPEEGVVA